MAAGHPSRHWSFVYNNYEEVDIQVIINYFETLNAEYLFQKEKGESGTPHLQGHVSFRDKRRWTQTKKQLKDAGVKKPNWHWEICRSIDHNLKYCSDEDKRDGGEEAIFTNIPQDEIEAAVDRVNTGSTRGATNQRKRKNASNSTATKFTAEELRIPPLHMLRKWQREVVDLVSGEPDDRSVHFFVDADGGTGKSLLSKFLVFHHGAIVVGGKTNDIAFHVKQTIDQGKPLKCVIVDIPRVASSFINYQGIEMCKNGLLFSGKYESGQILFPPPHLIVFTNQWPDETKLSADRYHIHEIKADPEWNSILPEILEMPEDVAPPVFGDDGDIDDDALFAYLNDY